MMGKKHVGNLGPYQDIVVDAKRAGGVEALIELIKSEAAREALVKAGPLLVAGGLAIGVAGRELVEFSKDQFAKRKAGKAAAAEAEEQLVELIEEAQRAQDEQDQADSPGGEGPQGKPSAD